MSSTTVAKPLAAARITRRVTASQVDGRADHLHDAQHDLPAGPRGGHDLPAAEHARHLPERRHDAVRGGIGIWPRVFSLQNYNVVFNMSTIYQAFLMSVLKTVVVVATNLFFTSMLAYALSRNEFIFRRSITLILVLTMYFDAGLIPNYLLIKDLGMLNSFQAYWVPRSSARST